MTLTALVDRARQHSLSVFGAFHTTVDDLTGPGTLIMLGPLEPGFWAHVTGEPEFTDGNDDPMDRWSRRVIDAIADEFSGTAHYPFGEPLQPFMTWALRSGRAWSSPVGLLVHNEAGLWVSYRGAIQVPRLLDLPTVPQNPCDACDTRPCLTACPVGALTASGYDLQSCHDYLDTAEGQSCMSRGCAVRRACPQSQKYRRVNEQSAFHMKRFHPCR